MDKVHDGTPRGSQSLCLTCRMSQRLRGLNLQEDIYCRAHQQPVKVPYPVESCSLYDDKRKPSLYWMEQVAWNVVSRKRGPTGFVGEDAAEIHVEPPQSPNVPNQSPTPLRDEEKK